MALSYDSGEAGRFKEKTLDALRRFITGGGLLFSDDCNHDVAGLYVSIIE